MPEHIKMPEVMPIVRYLANGAQVLFTYPFPIFASEDLHVFFDGARQTSGFDVMDAGQTSGGEIQFDAPPVNGVIVTLERHLPLERITDFLEGGDFSAQAINNELDYLTGSIQQISNDQAGMLRFETTEELGNVTLPNRAHRANSALGFDGNGDPVPISLEGAMAAPNFLATGAGATTRTSHDKFLDIVSIKDFGAVGDGLTDDTLAIQQALSAHQSIFVPNGTYLVSSPITLNHRQTMIGAGQSAVIRANGTGFSVIEMVSDYITLSTLRIEQGEIGLKLYGRDRPCVQNAVSDVTIWECGTGIQLDGYTDTNRPCYWNNFDRVLVAQPSLHGIHLMRSGAGDTPNANKFHACRVYSLGRDISGAGVYVEEGRFNNSFVDCEANVKGTAQACFHVGAGSDKTLFVNPYAESNNQVPNIRLDSGSIETSIFNLLSVSDGAAIWDLSGGEYTAYNAGFPYKNRFQRSIVTDLTTTLQRFDTEFIDANGSVDLDLSHSVHLVSSFGGALELRVPLASDAAGCEITIKKIDTSSNVITVSEQGGGSGVDRSAFFLGGQFDFVTMVSNGAEWFVTASNRMAGNTRFYDGSGLYDVDMAVDVYFVSSFGGALEVRLPPADAPEAIGRTVTIKKTDVSANVVTVTEQGGTGPDGFEQPLASQYSAITVVSDGRQWFITSKF
jgi:hypothetical protein